MKNILEIREIKKKPKLSELLSTFKSSKPEFIINQLEKLYSSKTKVTNFQTIDTKYIRLMDIFNRIQKVVTMQYDSLDLIEK
jgi:hypothetical protein